LLVMVVQDQLGNVHDSSADPRRSAGMPDTRGRGSAARVLNSDPVLTGRW
jgi:hypothetical protein